MDDAVLLSQSAMGIQEALKIFSSYRKAKYLHGIL